MFWLWKLCVVKSIHQKEVTYLLAVPTVSFRIRGEYYCLQGCINLPYYIMCLPLTLVKSYVYKTTINNTVFWFTVWSTSKCYLHITSVLKHNWCNIYSLFKVNPLHWHSNNIYSEQDNDFFMISLNLTPTKLPPLDTSLHHFNGLIPELMPDTLSSYLQTHVRHYLQGSTKRSVLVFT